ncbi:MAG: histidine kinase [Cyclobacteriaceae bacterium]
MKNKYLLLLCLVISQLPVLSQSSQQLRIDSLRKTLPGLSNNTLVDCLNELADQHWSFLEETNRKDSMYHYAVMANEAATKIRYQYGQALSLIQMSQYEFFVRRDALAGNALVKQAIEIGQAIKDDKILGKAYLMAGDLKKSAQHFRTAGDVVGELEATTWLCESYANEGKYEEGFDYCDRAVQLSKLITPQHSNWPHELVQWSYLNMATLYEAAGDYETSMDYIKQCDQYAKANNLSWRMTISIGKMFELAGQYDSALFYWQQWKKNYDSYAAGHKSFGDNILARIYLNTGRYDEALALTKAGGIATVKKSSPRPYGSLLLVARIYIHKRDWKAALKFATEGFDLAKKRKSRPSVMEGYELLSKIYHALGRDDHAYANLRQYTLLKDSILNRQFLWRLNNYKKAADDEKKKASVELLMKDNDIKDQQLKQEDLLKNFLIAGIISLVLTSFFIFRALRLQQKTERLGLENALTVHKLESEKQQAEFRQKAVELEMQALRAQMSPHFIFNCLSSINRFILKNETEAASDYLTRFSRLIRLVLSHSEKQWVPLEDELDLMRLYIEMERLRFKDSFDFNINFSRDLDPSAIMIPPLLLQPFAENAIWHGLMNKEGPGHLEISFSSDENILTCTIADNGVGRNKAEALKSKKDVKRKSMGLQITRDRLAKLNMESDRNTFFEVEDLYDQAGQAAGTKVVLKIRLASATLEVPVHHNNYA